MDPSGIEPTPGFEQEDELSSRSLSSSSLPSLFDSPIDECFIPEGDASQPFAQSVWQPQTKPYPEPQSFWPLLPDEWYHQGELPCFNEVIHAFPPSQSAPNNFHHTSFHHPQLGDVYQQSSQYFVEQPLPMIPQPIPAIPPPINMSSVSGDLDYQAYLIAPWYTSSQIAESAALAPIPSIWGNTEQYYVGNSLHSQHQTGPVAGSTTSFTGGLGVFPASAHAISSAAARRELHLPKRIRHPEIDDFPCTFCCDTFGSKHDWLRHEHSKHLVLGGWKCAPFGLLSPSGVNDAPICSYCGIEDPAEAHFGEEHESRPCNRDHVYARKDNLIQHLRTIHKVPKPPWLKTWQLKAPEVTSRCGFCDAQLGTWDARIEHLAGHFYEGKTMEDWEGEHGFTPEIAALVTTAIPPYTIAAESLKPEPFSATHPNRAKLMRDHQLLKQTSLVWEW